MMPSGARSESGDTRTRLSRDNSLYGQEPNPSQFLSVTQHEFVCFIRFSQPNDPPWCQHVAGSSREQPSVEHVAGRRCVGYRACTQINF